MNYPDEEHLPYIQSQIVVGIRAETGKTILSTYSISDQLNARGTEKETMQTAIDDMISEGKAKQEAVLAATTFAELNEVVPMKTE
jgi:hypothetical protein|tara:strand:+ start:795 stop:1049 length:255 start_codon:yes stop_codon:yes gene_type:complete